MIFRLVTSVGQRKILSPSEESNLRPSHSAHRCSTTEPQRHVLQIENICDLFKEKNSSCELNQPCLWNELKTREEAQFRFYVFLDFFPQVSTHLSQICPGCDTHNRVRLYETLHHVILNQINWIEPFNPLNPKRDQHLFSPNNNTAESFIKIMRKNKMLTN